MIHTYDIEPHFKELLSFNGIYLFGGKSENDRGETIMSSEVLFLNPKSSENAFLDNKLEGWECLSVRGKKPEPRINHTFHIINKKASCVLMGGAGKN